MRKGLVMLFLLLVLLSVLIQYVFGPFTKAAIDEDRIIGPLFLMVYYGVIVFVVRSLFLFFSSKRQPYIEKASLSFRDKFKSIVEDSNDIESFRDRKGKLLYVNPAIERIMGYEPQEYINANFELEDIVFHEDLKKAKECFELMLHQKRCYDKDIRFIRKDKNIVSCSVSINPVYDQREVFLGSRVSIRDISARKKVEKELAEKALTLQLLFDENLKSRQVLQEKEAFLEDVCHIAKIGGWEMDLKTGGKALWTKETYEIVGIQQGMPVPGYKEHINYYLPKYRDLVKKKMQEIVLGKDTMSYEAEFKTVKGQIKWAYARGTSIKENGKVIKIRGTFQDITERKKAEKELKVLNDELLENEARLKSKLDFIYKHEAVEGNIFLPDLIDVDDLQKIQDAFAKATGVASLMMDTKGVQITKPSNFCDVCNIIRRTKKGAEKCLLSDTQLGQNSFKKMKPEYQPCHSCGFMDASAPVILDGKPVAYWFIGQTNIGTVDKKRIVEYAKEIGANEQEMVEAFDKMVPVSSEKFEQALELLWLLAKEISALGYNNLILTKDLTKIKSREDELKDLAKFPSENPSPVLRISKKGTILYANKASKQILKKWQTDIGKKAPEKMRYIIEEVFKTKKNIEKEEVCAHKHFLFTISPVLEGGYANLYAADVTSRRQAERSLETYKDHLEQLVEERTMELELSNKELEAFSYSVSHDLRAPLRSMDGFSRILLETYKDKLDDEGKDNLMRVRKASQRMGKLIDDILTLSRVGRKDLAKQRVDLSKVAKETLEEIMKNDKTRDVEISVHPDLFVSADPSLFKVVMTNILDNAWKFTAKNKKTKIEVGSMEKGKEKIFFVRDNGVGFNMVYSDKLFAAFQRLHTEKDFPGTGIGLVSIKRIITRHKGHVWIESKEGKGTTFYFTLP